MGNYDESQTSLLSSVLFDVNKQFHIPVVKAMSQLYYHVFLALVNYVKD